MGKRGYYSLLAIHYSPIFLEILSLPFAGGKHLTNRLSSAEEGNITNKGDGNRV